GRAAGRVHGAVLGSGVQGLVEVAHDQVDVVLGHAGADERGAQVAAEVGEHVPGQGDDLVDTGQRVRVAEEGRVVGEAGEHGEQLVDAAPPPDRVDPEGGGAAGGGAGPRHPRPH